MTSRRNDILTWYQGQIYWTHCEGDKYIVTGVNVNGRRFKAMTFDSWHQAKCINLYRGTKWLLRDGHRYKIQSVYN